MFEDVRMDHFDTFRRFPGELGELGCHEAWDLDASQRRRLPRGGRHGRRVAWQRGGIRVDQRRAGSRSGTLRTLRTSHTSCTSVLGDFNHRENQYIQYTWDHLSLSIDLRDSYIDWYQAIDQFAVIFLSFLNYLFWEQLSCQKGSADKTDRHEPCECHTDAIRMPYGCHTDAIRMPYGCHTDATLLELTVQEVSNCTHSLRADMRCRAQAEHTTRLPKAIANWCRTRRCFYARHARLLHLDARCKKLTDSQTKCWGMLGYQSRFGTSSHKFQFCENCLNNASPYSLGKHVRT